MARRFLVFNLILGAALLAIRLFAWPTGPDLLPEGLVAVPGHIDGRHVVVASRLGGRLARVPVTVGECVGEGQVVAELEDAGLAARTREAKRDLKQAREAVRRLSPEPDAARPQPEAASQAALVQAMTRERQAQLRLNRLEADRLRRMITSPFTGVVAAVAVTPGDRLAPGAPVADLVDLETQRFTGRLPDAEAARLRIGLPGDVRLPGRPRRTVPAVVVALAKDPRRSGFSLVTMAFAAEQAPCLLPGQPASALLLSP